MNTLILEKLKSQAAILHKRAAETEAVLRFEAALEAVPARPALKHALEVIARECGFASWAELKHFLETLPADGVYAGSRGGGTFNQWFRAYPPAREAWERDGGFLFPFRNQYFVCEHEFVRGIGADPGDPDWDRAGRDFANPRDVQAWLRLARVLYAPRS
ncbi:MAG: hypothetical protein K2X35_21075 [Bryobacteraceae bacterium]|nr:hypothetical protein [Bryobacteraceae bacterium]